MQWASSSIALPEMVGSHLSNAMYARQCNAVNVLYLQTKSNLKASSHPSSSTNSPKRVADCWLRGEPQILLVNSGYSSYFWNANPKLSNHQDLCHLPLSLGSWKGTRARARAPSCSSKSLLLCGWRSKMTQGWPGKKMKASKLMHFQLIFQFDGRLGSFFSMFLSLPT